MTDETAPAAPSEQAESTDTKTETTKIPPDASVQGDAAPDETAETKPAEEAGDNSEEETAEPKRLTRSQRQQRKIARLSTLVAEQQGKIQELEKRSSADDLPKEADYNGDYIAYQTDLAAHKAAQKLGARLDEQAKAEANDKIVQARAEAADDFIERANELKPQIADFDQAFESFAKSGGAFAPHVIEELHDSDLGPMLAYQIAKDRGLADRLNAMSPRDAAREIGRLEAKTSLPKPRTLTQAPKPISPVSGGSSAKRSLAELAASDMDAYAKARDAQEKDRNR